MKVEFEIIHPDEGSSFRLLHTKDWAEQHPWLYHFHPEYELVCVLEGSGTRHVGNHFSSYEDGDLVFMGPNLPHAGFGLNAHGLHEEIVIQIREDVFKESVFTRPEMLQITQLLERVKQGLCFSGNIKQLIRKRLVRMLKLNNFERYVELLSILQLMAGSTEYDILNPGTSISSTVIKNNVRLQSIFNYVEKHYQEEIDMKKIASTVNLSVPSFCNYFKKLMTITFTDFVNQYRIQRACLLLQQEKTVTETCFDCGFNNITYFNKVFKLIVNKTPSEFKKEKASKLQSRVAELS